jgi:hypothetical protein
MPLVGGANSIQRHLGLVLRIGRQIGGEENDFQPGP